MVTMKIACASALLATLSAAAPAPQVVSQIADGQIQVVSQIADGQIQAPQVTAVPVTQIADGQIQAPPVSATPVSQIADVRCYASMRYE